MSKRTNTVEQSWYQPPTSEICPICQREIPQSQRDEHHLVPKCKGGKITQAMHRICHRQIHALFSEKELANDYNTAEALLAHESMQRFVNWIKNKPIGFSERTKKSRKK